VDGDSPTARIDAVSPATELDQLRQQAIEAAQQLDRDQARVKAQVI